MKIFDFSISEGFNENEISEEEKNTLIDRFIELALNESNKLDFIKIIFDYNQKADKKGVTLENLKKTSDEIYLHRLIDVLRQKLPTLLSSRLKELKPIISKKLELLSASNEFGESIRNLVDLSTLGNVEEAVT